MRISDNGKALLPAIILLVISTFTAYQLFAVQFVQSGRITRYELSTKHIAAFIALAITFFCWFAFRKIYNYVLAATVLLGLFNFINFTTDEITWCFRFNSAGVCVQPLLLFIALLVLFQHRSKVRRYFSDPEKKNIETTQSVSRNEVNRFKDQYRNSSREELEKLVSDLRFNEATRQAAKELIQETAGSGNL